MTAEKLRRQRMELLVGLGFETISELQSYLKEGFSEGFVKVSDLQIPVDEFGDEFIDVELGEFEYYTLYLAQGRSGRYYIVEVE